MSSGIPSQLRSGAGSLTDAATVNPETKAMIMCINNFLVQEATAVFLAYRVFRYDQMGLTMTPEKEREILGNCIRYQLLQGVGVDLEQILYCVIHEEPLPDGFNLEAYSGVMEDYQEVLGRLHRGQTGTEIVEWLTAKGEASRHAALEGSSDEEGSADEDEEGPTMDEILEGVDAAPGMWDAFTPTTEIQHQIHASMSRFFARS